MADLKSWVSGARLRTLPLAVAPVALGAATAEATQNFDALLTFGALLVALFLQIAVNYANDYSDGVRGTDEFRVGPKRLTGSGEARADDVKRVAFVFFGLAALVGLALVIATSQYWLLAFGAFAILAAWYYTGGKHPYGYAGLGEVVVFVFFGLFATVGTNFIQTLSLDPLAIVLGSAAGFYASAVLLINNIRDIATDTQAGKKTLAVRLGDRRSRVLFLFLIFIPLAINILLILVYPATLLGLANVLLLVPISGIALSGRTPKELITGLKLTSYAGLGYGLLVGAGLVLVNF
ncbi:1,4-dihydroxy-2-naphthoate polyprenyltransferase [Aquiluna sp. KACHI24]|uniref:1,4-dihydroxy-2-naphthoate polyprenyltransferase n=1 Tax=Aquiluna sp. KACHI24 TaxID=2968831 RepID=UPI00220FED21|nr:1,4-dihydroxy-2-naphthoate polyprenyltransferase [Aquiluna sp. KACHI24]BDQ00861.1 1,4-dihydroxy-2-naphthoate octaprenyltransferase [Aquiluna sp. KACHI24]